MKRILVLLFALSMSTLASAEVPALPKSYAPFDSQGRLQAKGDSALVWDEIVIRPSSVRYSPVSTKPDWGYWLFPGMTYLMDAANPESLYFHCEIHHDKLIGDPLHVHVHWSPLTTDTGKVAWKIAWMMADTDGTFAFAAGDTMSVQDAGDGTAFKSQYIEIGEIPTTTVTGVGAIISGVLVRDGNLGSDTFTGEAAFLDLGFHYRKDSMGSKWELIK